jgi:uncharacterized protein YjbI with pentapeptide repeats
MKKNRSLLAGVATSILGDSSTDRLMGLTTFDPGDLLGGGIPQMMDTAAERCSDTAASVSSEGRGLRNLLLVEFSPDGPTKEVWVIDGWSFLRRHGSGLDLRYADLRGAFLSGAPLRTSDLKDAKLTGANLTRADLSCCDMSRADFSAVDFYSASLNGCNLTETDLSRANLRHADLRDTTCVRTAFRGADFWMSYLWDVDLSRAFTIGADVTRADYLNTKVPNRRVKNE